MRTKIQKGGLIRLGDIGREVLEMQRLLNEKGGIKKIGDDGIFGNKTQKAIIAVQKSAGLPQDGVFGIRTLNILDGKPEQTNRLTESDFINCAELLGVEVAALKAVSLVESAGSGFLPNGKPKILFERHQFRKAILKYFTAAKVDALCLSRPLIVNKKAGGYVGGSGEWLRFEQAEAIHATAAIEAASWGRFQIMGFNHKSAGFDTPELFRVAMEANEGEHLKAVSNFIKNNPAIHKALKAKNWAAFAKGYNGVNYAINQYDKKLERAYREIAGGK